jgi:hypothetical protein
MNAPMMCFQKSAPAVQAMAGTPLAGADEARASSLAHKVKLKARAGEDGEQPSLPKPRRDGDHPDSL